MATQNNRTVTLTLATQTTGQESVKSLAAELHKMAQEGGDAAPEFARLAQSLEQASNAEEKQSKAARAAAANMQASKQSMLEARAAMSTYTASIGGAKNATAEQKAELAKLNQTIRDGKASYDQARASVATLTPEYNRLKASTRGVISEAERLKTAVKAPGEAAADSAKKMDLSFTGMARSLRGMAGGLAAALGLDQFVKANTSVESLRRSLEQMTGSGEAAAREIDYLKAAANRLGLDVNDAGRAYINLTAAAKGTALEGAGTKAIFEAVSGAMSKLGKSSAETEGALQAVAQMMSKGTVSMEEMRQQLGERLPGAMQAAADASGVTVGELTAMIGTGQVLASDLLPKLADGLQKMYGTGAQAEGMVSSWNRLKNSISETLVFIGDSGVVTALVGIMGQLGFAVRGLTGAFELLGRIIGITFGAIAAFDWKHPIDSVKNWKTAVSEAGAEIQKKMDAVKGSAENAGEAQSKLAEAGKKAAESASAQAVTWLTVVNSFGKVTAAAKEATEQAIKSAAAKAEEGKTSVALAQAFGTETEKRTSALAAANANTIALKAVAEARLLEAEAANSNAIALAEAAKAEAVLSEEKRKAIVAATDNATAKKSEADQAASAALAAQQHAAALSVESAALQDNSGRVLELKAAYEAAQASLEAVRLAREAGTATMVDEQSAAIAAGEAAFLYRDALSDQTRVIEQNAKQKQAQLNVDQAGVRLAIEQQKSILEMAKVRGDEYAVTQSLMEIKQLEIKLAELTAQAKKAEADAALLTVKAKRAELEASGQLTKAKEAELAAEEAGAKVKQVEAEISAELAKRTRELADEVAYSGDAATKATKDYEKLAESLDGVADSADTASGKIRDLQDQQTRTAAGQPNTSAINFAGLAKNRGATPEQAAEVQASAGEIFSRMMQESPTASALGVRGLISNAVDEAMAALGVKARTGAPQEASSGRQVATPATTVHRVEISFRGATTPVNVASSQDANSLLGILRQLETDAARTF